MNIIDRVRSQAEELLQTGQGKLQQAQAQRRTDGLLRELGRAVRDQRKGVGGAAADERVDRLLAELDEQEERAAEHGTQPEPAGDVPMGQGRSVPEGASIDLTEPVGTSIPAPEPMAPGAPGPSRPPIGP